MRTAELEGATFACLEGCGFCCTFPPEASRLELGRLRARLAPRPVPVTVGEGRSYLALQNACGACTLLERRQCQAYDLRPSHCRYFPFHLHFAEEPEVYVNRTCRGVERTERADDRLAAAFEANVLAHAGAGEVARHEREAREAYAQFRRLAKRHGAWGDADAAVARALEAEDALFASDSVAALARGAGLDDDLDALHQEALRPFGARDVTQRPFYLDPDLRWLTFDREGDGALLVVEMDERGALETSGRIDGLACWAPLAPAQARALFPYVRALAQRRLFVGSAYALVDDDEYRTSVEEAVRARFVELVCDLTLRARVLLAMGVAEAALADEVARFYDSTFLDTPTIGGFL